MTFEIYITQKAPKDIEKINKSGNKKLLAKLEVLLNDRRTSIPWNWKTRTFKDQLFWSMVTKIKFRTPADLFSKWTNHNCGLNFCLWSL